MKTIILFRWKSKNFFLWFVLFVTRYIIQAISLMPNFIDTKNSYSYSFISKPDTPYIPTHTYHTITSNLRVHTITYASFTFTHAIQNDDIDMNMNMNMTPIDPRFLSLLIRVTIWYDTIRYIRVSSICNPSVLFLLYYTIRVPTSLYYYNVILNSSQSILLHAYIHSWRWYDDVIQLDSLRRYTR